MKKVKVTKENLFRTINEIVKEEGGAANATNVGGANFTPGTGEQYATPKAFKKKVKESNTSAPFEKKFKHGTHPGAKAMDYKQLFEKPIDSVNEADIPENIRKFAKKKGVTNIVNQVARWAEKSGRRIVGGTAIGKNYSTLILDLTHHGSEVYINTDDETVEVKGEEVYNYNDFIKALEPQKIASEDISGIVQPSNLDQDSWDKATGHKSDLVGDIYKEEVALTDFIDYKKTLKDAYVDLFRHKVSGASIVGDAYDSLQYKDPDIQAKLDAAKDVIAKNITSTNRDRYLGAIDNIKAYLNQTLQENYSKFKTETKTRTKPEQFHQAVKGIRRKVDEVAKLFEYCSQLKNELAEGEQPFTYGSRTEALMGKVQNSIRETLRKVSALTNENSIDEVLTPDDYSKAMEILKQIEAKNPKIYRAILDMVIDIYPHSSKEIDNLLSKSNIQVNEKVNK